ncbi:tripartite tricarboxylate transporter substrate binding protein [Roseomonas terrae]|jgi:tripartite-type tricarboxylate transporter receptor subunit TctC|uniref:Tripartite tricarboxylate transporter substrate binding protein n=1 Tax=Neoroseomonas terrae TaxID=424799 RepID=A0ABS5EDE4_9PROT|nr:tripartite tricarboxylate transporter substrate binding protein [Neoroseomonas terrae]MBR0649029.1 tripartite tricarboxylate transporter substrate binding protein [Neoroseomonas terrae]
MKSTKPAITLKRRNLVLAGFGAGIAAPALAQTGFPNRSLRIIVPFGPGGSGDISARLCAQYIETTAGQPVVVENRPGANGVIGTMAVKAAPADGYTLLLCTTSTHAANPSLIRNLPYDPTTDFDVVGMFGSAGSYFLVRSESPLQSIPALVAAARAQPGRYSFGHFNTASRMPAEILSKAADIQLLGVPYRVVGTAMSDLLAGRIDFVVQETSAADSYLKNNQVRALAVTRAQRWDRHPDLPSIAEFYPDAALPGLLGIAVPKGTPMLVMQRLNEFAVGALNSSPMRERLEEFGHTIGRYNLEDCATFARDLRARYARYIAMAGIEPE